jgi:hypothetical protein
MFTWGNAAEWAGFVGELVVAAAIVWELDETRRFNFLSEVSSSKMYKARGEIYDAFMDAEGKSITEKSEAIRNRIWSDAVFKTKCDKQILLFEKVGILARYSLSDKLFPRDQFVSVFPHAVIAFRVMLQGYMRNREERTGPWWAQNFSRFTVNCIDYILKQKERRVRIHSANRAPTEDLIIDERELLQLRSQLRAARPSLWG